MVFRFNFFENDDMEGSQNSDITTETSDINPKVHDYDSENISLLFSQWVEIRLPDDEKLYYLNNVDKGKIETVTEHSDLIPNIYEGGFEVWECTLDILRYFASHQEKFSFKKVLDLGCGSGLLGTYTAIHGAECVHFQDYNQEVVENFTIKNYHKNCEKSPCSVKFVSGDWDDMGDHFDTYDLILSSETIYNRDSISKVIRIIQNHLCPSGMALIGTKRHYFGMLLGGGLVEFQEHLAKIPELQAEVIWSSSTGLTRDIVCVTFKKTPSPVKH